MANYCNKCLVEVDAHTFRFFENRVYCTPCLVFHKKVLAEIEQKKATPPLPRTRFEREDPL